MTKLKSTAYRPGTRNNQLSQFKKYVAFCTHYSLQDIDPDTKTVCLYATYLSKTLTSPASVLHHISGVCHMHKLLNITAPALDSFDLTLTLRSIMLNVLHVLNHRKPITLQQLKDMVHLCDSLDGPLGVTVKAAILIAF